MSLPYQGSVFALFAEWYTSSNCTDAHVASMINLQNIGSSTFQRLLTAYLTFCTRCGDGEAYVVSCAMLVVLGFSNEAVHACVMLAVATYCVGVLKDLAWCPRPPAPARRNISHAHQKEYGFPSTHTVMAVTFAYLAVCFAASVAPQISLHVAVAATFFATQVSFSRYYLGAHWAADIAAGVLVAAVLIALDQVLIREVFYSTVFHNQHLVWWHLMLPLALGRGLLVIHATPRDACPCFLDSCRFLGVSTGFVTGALWNVFLSRRPAVHIISLPAETSVWVLVGASVLNVILAFIALRMASLLFGGVLPPVLRILSGAIDVQMTPMVRQTYRVFCSAAGIVLGKRLISAPRDKTRDAPTTDAGPVWCLSTHNHWDEALALTKFLAYFISGFVTVALAPRAVDSLLRSYHHVA